MSVFKVRMSISGVGCLKSSKLEAAYGGTDRSSKRILVYLMTEFAKDGYYLTSSYRMSKKGESSRISLSFDLSDLTPPHDRFDSKQND